MTTGSNHYEKTPLRWLFLDFDNYFAAVEQQENPQWRGRPLIVVPVEGSQATGAIAVSRQAKALGIRRGTPLAEARRICPDVAVAVARHDAYVRWHHRLLAEIERHVPIARVHSVDELSARLGRGQDTPQAARQLAMRIKRGIAANVGEVLTCSIGLAPSRLLAKVAAEMDKPDGLRVLLPQNLPAALEELALEDLPGISHGISRRLAAAGIHDVRSLWQLAPRQARAIWGSVAGERFIRALHGEDVEDTPPPGAPRSFGHGRVLAPEHRRLAAAWPVACALLLKAAERMRQADMAARLVVLSARWLQAEGQGGRMVFHQPLEVATADSFHLLRALGHAWRRLRRQAAQRRDDRLRDVQVYLTRLEPLRERQLDLFADALEKGASRRRERLWTEIDQLNRRFGERTIEPAALRHLQLQYLGAKIAFGRIPELPERERARFSK